MFVFNLFCVLRIIFDFVRQPFDLVWRLFSELIHKYLRCYLIILMQYIHMQKFTFLLGLFILLSIPHFIYAQPCATITFSGTINGVFPCDSTLSVTAATSFPQPNNTDDYTVAAVPYTPEPWNNPNSILANIDDCWSGIVPLPFPFCYYGQVYNSFVVGANGQISFDIVGTQPALVGGSNNWNSWNGGPPNNFVAPFNTLPMNNCIMSPYHDIDPSVSSSNPSITWGINGQAPCRKMVISFDNIAMFSCNNLIARHQVVLNELTNEIDIFIENKPVCNAWNGGIAHLGIQNANGTQAVMVPGRNGTVWNATNEGWRFSPSGAQTPLSFLYNWFNGANGAFLGSGLNITIPPPVTVNSLVFQVATSGGCFPYTFSDTLDLTFGVSADFSTDINLGCDFDTVKFTAITQPTSGNNYYWDFGDGSPISTQQNPTHYYNIHQPYTITLIVDHPPCIPDTIVKSIDLSHPINAEFVTTTPVTPPVIQDNDSTCIGVRFDAFSTSIGGNLRHTWNWGDGTVSSYPYGIIADTHTYLQPGTYTLTLYVTDTLNCVDSLKRDLFVEALGYADFTVSENDVCVGSPIYFNDSVAPHTLSFTWDFGDNKKLVDVHNPTHVYDIPKSPYSVELIANYFKCPPVIYTLPINVEDYPVVNLGSDTSYCPGVTQPISLFNLFASTTPLIWSTGENASSISASNSGYYWARAASNNGKCLTTDSIWVKRDCFINIPNSFSPNGDGLNDYFFPRDLLSSGLASFKLSVYNRWGQEIFVTTQLDGRGWDGNYGGKEQQMGVYVYTIDATFKNKIFKTFKGNVTLVR